MTDKHEVACKGDKYAKASLGMQILGYATAVIITIVVWQFVVSPLLGGVGDIQNLFDQIPTP